MEELIRHWGTPEQPSKLALSLSEAERAASKGQIDRAISKYKDIDRMVASNPLVKMRLGTLLAKRPSSNSQHAAELLFQQVARDYARHSDARRELGLAQQRSYIRNGRPSGGHTGERELTAAFHLTQGDPEIVEALATIYKDKGLYENFLELPKGATTCGELGLRREFDHLLKGGLELDFKPLYVRGRNTVYDVSLRNLPRGTRRAAVDKVVSP